MRNQRVFQVVYCGLAAWLFAAADCAHAWGPQGHLIIGQAAEPLLCDRSVKALGALGQGESIGQLGLWADRVRREEQWKHTAPWHYINIPDNSDLRHISHSPEGNVILAIEDARSTLRSSNATVQQKRDALRLFIHFVADIHQPLHVGRASDRGGNMIDINFSSTHMNLHAFWDTEVIRQYDLSISEYANVIASAARRVMRRDQYSDVIDWTRQSFRLRDQVYSFNQSSGRLLPAYIRTAKRISRRQLAFAAARLASQINSLFCDP